MATIDTTAAHDPKHLTDEVLRELENEHGGRVRVFKDANDPPEWAVVLRKPNGKEAQAFRLTANHDGRKAYAALDIVKSTMVWPAKDAIKDLIDEQPFMPEGITGDSAWKKWVGLEVAEDNRKS